MALIYSGLNNLEIIPDNILGAYGYGFESRTASNVSLVQNEKRFEPSNDSSTQVHSKMSLHTQLIGKALHPFLAAFKSCNIRH